MRVENTLRRGELILKPGLRLETRVRWVDLQVLNNIVHEHDHVEDNSDCQCFTTGLITCARDSCAVLAVATSTLNKSAIGLFRSLHHHHHLHHHHLHHHHLHHHDSPAILNMVSPQCSVLREAFSTFEMRTRIARLSVSQIRR